MKARVNKVTEPITIAVQDSRLNYVVSLLVGDILTRFEGGEYFYIDGETPREIPSAIMDIVKTEPCPTLDVKLFVNSNSRLIVQIEDGEFFTSDEIAQAVKKAIDKTRRICLPRNATNDTQNTIRSTN